MEEQESNQKRIEPRVSVSRDGKWVIIRVEGLEQAIIKPVAYFEQIIKTAKTRGTNASEIGRIKG
jgi:hypothetical protein